MTRTLFISLLFLANSLSSQSTIELETINSLADYQSSTCLIIYDGSYTCTGTLINNTSGDGRPLILTAAHCIEDPEQISSIVVVFGRHYLLQNSLLESQEWRSDFGATLLSFSYETDHALIELNQELPDWLMPRFLGWNAQETRNTITSSIHHPTFDFKQLAHNRTPVEVATFLGIENSLLAGHWRVNNWSFGGTLEGSSGAALLDSQLRIIGGLSGSTFRGEEEIDFYYRLDQALQQSDELRSFLDPINSSALLVDEIGFPELRQLSRVVNYSFTDTLAAAQILTNENSLVQSFGELEGLIRGVYLVINQIEGDLLNSMTISVEVDSEEVFAEEVNLFTLFERGENFVPFITTVPVDGEVGIRVNLNAGLSTDFVECPSVIHSTDRTPLNGLLVEQLEQDVEEELTFSEVQLFPNPAQGFVTVNQTLLSVRLVNMKGKEVVPRTLLDHNQHTIVDLEGIQAGIYIMQLKVESGETLRQNIIVR